ncbi:MAG: hypothetical protein AAFQ98_17270 [Bacteroidota bacterium]
MRNIVANRAQTAYNCGVYSLWMALESISGRDNDLIRSITHYAKMYTDSMGGIFNNVHMERVIEALGYSCKKVGFHDVGSFVRNVNNHQNDAILLAYSLDMLDGDELPANTEPGDSAHWSVLTRLNQQGNNATIANPHGWDEDCDLGLLVNANTALKNSRFNWKTFVNAQLANPEGSAQFEREMKLYKNTKEELVKRGRQDIHLGNYFLAINN